MHNPGSASHATVSPMPSGPRRVRVEQIMGTAIGIDLRDLDVAEDAVDAAFEALREADARFSTYKPGSEISRLGRAELTLEECHPDVAIVLGLCEYLREQTGGAFNAWRCRTDGRLDPSGAVKGWAVERSAEILSRAGARNFCINAGGDVIARGEPEAGRPWRVGIRHPGQPTAVAAVVGVRDFAVATSGTYERGDHIIDPRTGVAAHDLVSMTVAGPSLTLTDAYATAAMAMGRSGVEWVASLPGYAPYAVTTTGRVRYSNAFAQLLVRSA
jgi:thiamine biosynthesis lipoprotein